MTTASIQGQVVASDTANAIEGATVVVTFAARPTEEMATTTTSSNGEFAVTVDASAGAVDVLVEAVGQDHAIGRFGAPAAEPCRFGPQSAEAPGAVTLEAGDDLKGVVIELEPGGRISGRVVDAQTGIPLEQARVELHSDAGWPCSQRFHATTDAQGEYEAPLAVPVGDYHVLAAPAYGENYVTQAWDGIPCTHGRCAVVQSDVLEVASAGVVPDIDFWLEPGAVIEGSLLPDDEQRRVLLFSGAGVPLQAVPVPDYGQPFPADDWTIQGLAGGSYYLEFGANPSAGATEPGNALIRVLHNGLFCPWGGCERARGAPISIPSGSTLTLPTTSLQSGGWIEGVIVDKATGEAPPAVSEGQELGHYDVVDLEGNVASGGIIVVEGGQVRLTPSAAMPPGDYRVRTYHDFRGEGVGYRHDGSAGDAELAGYSDAMYPDVPCAGIGCDVSQAQAVPVSEDQPTTVVIELSPGSYVSGTVADADTSEGVGDAVVKLVDVNGRVLAATMAEDDGSYRFGGFPAGEYYLRTSMGGRTGFGTGAPQLPYFDKVYGAPSNCSELLCDPASGTPLTLDGSTDATGIDLSVPSGPVISGRVIFALTGMPIQRGFVRVSEQEGDLVGRFRISTATARYQTAALPPGDYVLEAEVSPAFADVSTSRSGERAGRGSAAGSRDDGLVVTVGTSSVEADLTVIDVSLDRIFDSRFTGEGEDG